MTNSTANVYQDGSRAPGHQADPRRRPATGPRAGSRPSAPTSPRRPAASCASRPRCSSPTSAAPPRPATGRRSGCSARPPAAPAPPTGRASARSTSWRTSTAAAPSSARCTAASSPGGPCNETTGIGSGERACAGCQTGFHTYAHGVRPQRLAGADPLVPRRQQLLHRQRQPGGRDDLEQRHPPRLLHDPQRGDRRRLPGRVRRRPDRARPCPACRCSSTTSPPTPAAAAAAPTTPPPATGKAVTNANGLCLDDRSSNSGQRQPGPDLGLQRHRRAAVDLRRGRAARCTSLGKCLDIAGGGTANGTKVQLWDCNNTGAQVFIHRSQRRVLQPAVQQVPRRPGGVDDAGHPGADLGLQRLRRPEVHAAPVAPTGPQMPPFDGRLRAPCSRSASTLTRDSPLLNYSELVRWPRLFGMARCPSSWPRGWSCWSA